MGRRILSLLLEDPELELAGIREAPGTEPWGRMRGCSWGARTWEFRLSILSGTCRLTRCDY